jgi:hypothetical protein
MPELEPQIQDRQRVFRTHRIHYQHEAEDCKTVDAKAID